MTLRSLLCRIILILVTELVRMRRNDSFIPRVIANPASRWDHNAQQESLFTNVRFIYQ